MQPEDTLSDSHGAFNRYLLGTWPGARGQRVSQDLRTKRSRNQMIQVYLVPRSDPSELVGEDKQSLVAMKGHLGRHPGSFWGFYFLNFLFLRQECNKACKDAACFHFSVAVVQYLCFEHYSFGKAFYSNVGNFKDANAFSVSLAKQECFSSGNFPVKKKKKIYRYSTFCNLR